MGFFSNLIELLRDGSLEEVEQEASKEVTIVVTGSNSEVRDKLHDALSARLESIWTSSPFSKIDVNQQPDAGEGLLLYAMYVGDRIPAEKRAWLKQVAATPDVAVIVAVLPRQRDNNIQPPKPRQRLQVINPMRFIGGADGSNDSGPSADGAGVDPTDVRAGWEVELDELPGEKERLTVVRLTGLELAQLEHELLPVIVKNLPDLELALARRAPVFRNAVAAHFINKIARSNAETVLFANATSGIPFLSGLFGGGADFILLTKNQFELSHRLATIYGQKRDSRVEMYLELAPIVGSAFVWRMLARYSTEKLPAFLGLFPKAVIAYIATQAVGYSARWYYAGGRTAPGQIAALARQWFERVTGQASNPPDSNSGGGPRRLAKF